MKKTQSFPMLRTKSGEGATYKEWDPTEANFVVCLLSRPFVARLSPPAMILNHIICHLRADIV